MKKGTIILSGRYKGKTLLVPTEAKNVYLVDKGADWKPIYQDYILNEDGSQTITALDFDGGPKIFVGEKIKGKEIAAFHNVDGKTFVEFV